MQTSEAFFVQRWYALKRQAAIEIESARGYNTYSEYEHSRGVVRGLKYPEQPSRRTRRALAALERRHARQLAAIVRNFERASG